ncbi:MAG: GDSL-type esterase/lipase family protein [Planctomycetes bacterium]|nr:GDSL-type esterase/lipase family protein [Planctomycetota bacterium]
MRAFEAADAVEPPPLGANLFLGSSSIRMWDLAADFAGFPVVQRGFGGSEVADSVRYAPRIVLPCKPSVVVFYAGDNDIANGKTPERVAEDFGELVTLVHRELPDTRIVFVSIKPSLQRWALADAMRRANGLVRELATRDPLVEFVDVWPAMLGPDGLPRASFFVEDGLHLSRDGYRAWAELVRPLLVR